MKKKVCSQDGKKKEQTGKSTKQRLESSQTTNHAENVDDA